MNCSKWTFSQICWYYFDLVLVKNTKWTFSFFYRFCTVIDNTTVKATLRLLKKFNTRKCHSNSGTVQFEWFTYKLISRRCMFTLFSVFFNLFCYFVHIFFCSLPRFITTKSIGSNEFMSHIKNLISPHMLVVHILFRIYAIIVRIALNWMLNALFSLIPTYSIYVLASKFR